MLARRPDAALRAHDDAGADHRTGADAAFGADLRIGADHHQRPDFGRVVDARRRIDHRGGVDAGAQGCGGMEQRRDPRPADLRVSDHDRRGACGHARGVLGGDDHRAGAGFGQDGQVFAVVEEADFGRAGGLERCGTGDHGVRQVGGGGAGRGGHLRE